MNTEERHDHEDAERSLEAIVERLSKEHEEKRTECEAIEAELRRAKLSLAAFRGELEHRGRRGSAERGGLSEGEVRNLVTEALTRGPATRDALKVLLLQEAKERSLPGTGVHKVLDKVLKDEQFVPGVSGYTLRERRESA